MLYLLLLYPSLLNLANANDQAIVISLGGEVATWKPPSDISLLNSPPITIDVVHTDINTIIRLFTNHSDANIILADGIQGNISAQITNVPWQLALLSITQGNGWTLLQIGEIWLITP